MHHRREVVRPDVGTGRRLAELRRCAAGDVGVIDRDVVVAVVPVVLVAETHGVTDLVNEAPATILREVDRLSPADPTEIRATGEAVSGPHELHVVALSAARHEVDRSSCLPVGDGFGDALAGCRRRTGSDGVGHLTVRPLPLRSGVDETALEAFGAVRALAQRRGIDAVRLHVAVEADDDVPVDNGHPVNHIVGDHLAGAPHGGCRLTGRGRGLACVVRRFDPRADHDCGHGDQGNDQRATDVAPAVQVRARAQTRVWARVKARQHQSSSSERRSPVAP